MKSIIKYTVLGLSAGLMLLTSCTGNFKEIKDGFNRITEEDLLQDNNIIGAGFQPAMQSIYYSAPGSEWIYQLIQNLNADIWSGYMASATAFEGNANNQTYNLLPGWNDYCWDNYYQRVMPPLTSVRTACIRYGFPEDGVLEDDQIATKDWKESVYAHYIAVNTILRVFGMSRLADQYGPIIYSGYGDPDRGNTYDSLQDVYDLFFAELKEAVELLDDKLTSGDYASFEKFDVIYAGDLAKWARLGNTLRLRLAMRIVKADAAKAKTQGEAAIAAPQGVMKRGDAYILSGHGWENPLNVLSVGWGDIHISANMQSILGGYGDPRLPLYGTPRDGAVIGMRAGLPELVDVSAAYKAVISSVNVPAPSARTVLMSDSEAAFLKAEAALRGWNTGGGTAQAFYTEGIENSFALMGASLGSYLDNTNVPADWVDPIGRTNCNIAAVSTVTPKWDEAASNEVKLEKIITQKWIAGFPDGMNAWAEWRRTGYPKLFPIGVNMSPNNQIPTELGVRRLPYTEGQKRDNETGVADAVSKLGGPDNGATRLFWDVAGKGNF